MKSQWVDYAVKAQCGNPTSKWAHMQFVKDHFFKVVSAHCATMDWSLAYECEISVWELFSTETKNKKGTGREWFIKPSPIIPACEEKVLRAWHEIVSQYRKKYSWNMFTPAISTSAEVGKQHPSSPLSWSWMERGRSLPEEFPNCRPKSCCCPYKLNHTHLQQKEHSVQLCLVLMSCNASYCFCIINAYREVLAFFLSFLSLQSMLQIIQKYYLVQIQRSCPS